MTTCIPALITAGLNFSASVMDAGHPTPAWVFNLYLRGPSKIDLQAASGGNFNATAAQTADWTPGTYWWTIRASRGADVHEVGAGQIIVKPDPVAATGPFDGRTDNEVALEAINAVIAKRASLDQERYRINNRELYRTPVSQLIKLRAFYVAAVAREKRKASGSTSWGRPVPVRFSS